MARLRGGGATLGLALIAALTATGCGGPSTSTESGQAPTTGGSRAASPTNAPTPAQRAARARHDARIQKLRDAFYPRAHADCPDRRFPQTDYPYLAANIQVEGVSCADAEQLVTQAYDPCKLFDCHVAGYNCLQLDAESQAVDGGCFKGPRVVVWSWFGGY